MSENAGLDALLTSVSSRDWGALSLLRTHVGAHYDQELFVVGRATNGWGAPFTAADVTDPAGRAKVIEASQLRAMDWVAAEWSAPKGKYATRRSAFWRVTRRVASGLGIEGPGWSTRIAWSNLYRVAPAAGGNPSDPLCRAQEAACLDLLRQDLGTHRPRHVLVLAGENWFRPFGKGLGCVLTGVNEDAIDCLGVVGESKVVVARHPQGRREAAMVARILQNFGAP
jgi:hypothetical protein